MLLLSDNISSQLKNIYLFNVIFIPTNLQNTAKWDITWDLITLKVVLLFVHLITVKGMYLPAWEEKSGRKVRRYKTASNFYYPYFTVLFHEIYFLITIIYFTGILFCPDKT